MAENNKVFAVLTGDVVDSSRISDSDFSTLGDTLNNAFKEIESSEGSPSSPAFERFRGDSFQGILKNPVKAMKSALKIKALLRSFQPEGGKVAWDARIAIGIGTVSHLEENPTAGDGEAYRNSGPVLDNFKSEDRLAIQTPWKSVNEELNVSCSLVDAIIAKWSAPQAETFLMLMNHKKREEIADELGISQAAVHYRVKGAGWHALKKFVDRYQIIIKQYLNN